MNEIKRELNRRMKNSNVVPLGKRLAWLSCEHSIELEKIKLYIYKKNVEFSNVISRHVKSSRLGRLDIGSYLWAPLIISCKIVANEDFSIKSSDDLCFCLVISPRSHIYYSLHDEQVVWPERVRLFRKPQFRRLSL